jgi:hypothetical protein
MATLGERNPGFSRSEWESQLASGRPKSVGWRLSGAGEITLEKPGKTPENRGLLVTGERSGAAESPPSPGLGHGWGGEGLLEWFRQGRGEA